MRKTLALIFLLVASVFVAQSLVVYAAEYQQQPIVLDPDGTFQEGSRIGSYEVLDCGEETGDGEGMFDGGGYLDSLNWDGSTCGPTGGPVLIASQIINRLLQVLGLIALAIMVYGGYIWMMARGNEEEVGKARNLVIGTVSAIGIILSSYLIMNFIFTAFVGYSGGYTGGLGI